MNLTTLLSESFAIGCLICGYGHAACTVCRSYYKLRGRCPVHVRHWSVQKLGVRKAETGRENKKWKQLNLGVKGAKTRNSYHPPPLLPPPPPLSLNFFFLWHLFCNLAGNFSLWLCLIKYAATLIILYKSYVFNYLSLIRDVFRRDSAFLNSQ